MDEVRPEARLGAALRGAREDKGVALRALARRLYRAHSTLVEYERGHRLAPLEVVQAYEVALDVEAGQLVALHEEAVLQLCGDDHPSHRRIVIIERAAPERLLKSFSARGPGLVGRAHELAILESELRRAAQGELRCVLITSDPGVGKSRLLTELLARSAEDVVCMKARAYSAGRAEPFGLWTEALGLNLSQLAAGQAAKARDESLSRARVLDGLGSALRHLSGQGPVMIALDDVHLADPCSWETLRYLVDHVSDARILVVAAARTAELAQRDIASWVLLGLEQEGLLRRLPLQPLAREALAALVQAVLGRPPPEGLADWLVHRSRGNPLFAIGLLQALLDEHADLSRPRLGRLPDGLADRVNRHLRVLDRPALATIEMLAMIGRRVEIDDLVLVADQPGDRLAGHLEELVRSRLVVEEECGHSLAYEIAHPLIQEAVYQSIGAARRRLLQRSINRSCLRPAGVREPL
jgi:transcriptional regulator with XRE-family HTH domain